MIDTSRQFFEEHSQMYLSHLKAGEEIRIDQENGKTLSITGKSVGLKELGNDTCDVVTSRERFEANGNRYYRDLANEDVIGVILNDDQGLLLTPQILEEKQENSYQVSFDGGREFSLTEKELNRALDMIEVAGNDHPKLLSIQEQMRQQAEAGQRIRLSLSEGSQLMPVWQEEDRIARLLDSSDQDAHILEEFQNYDGKKEQMFANIMGQLREDPPDLSLTEDDLQFGEQMTLDDFGVK